MATPSSPPHDATAERALLGAMLLSSASGSASELAATVRPQAFWLESHRVIARAWLETGAGDYVQVVAYLRNHGLLDMAGGAPAVVQLATETPSSANWRHYHGIVQELAARRDLLAATQRATAAAMRGDDLEALVSDLGSAIMRATAARSEDATQHIPAVLSEVLDRAEASAKKRAEGHPAAWTWGAPELDEVCPVRRGELVVVGARKKSGKTSVALQGATATAATGQGVLFVSLEMTRVGIGARILSQASGVPDAHILDGSVDGPGFERMAGAIEPLAGLPLWVSQPGIAYQTVAREIRAQVAMHPEIGFVVIDYLQLFRWDGREIFDSVGVMSKELAALARELGVAVVLLSQLNRESERDKRPPTAADLRQSGQIEEAADRILLMSRPYYGDLGKPDILLLQIGAERWQVDGAPTTIELRRDRAGRFVPAWST